jgi:GT2 family glycosyltransferase/acyl carrier protein
MVDNENVPYIYIIVLCCNSKKWLSKCIDSLLKTDYSNYKVLLVDNASTDGSVEEIVTRFPELSVIRNPKNYGWCKGNNIGIRFALGQGADMIYLANADTQYPQTDWLIRLLKIYNEHKKYRLLGPLQYKYGSDTELNGWSKYILKNGSKDVHHMWSSKLDQHGKSYEEDALALEFVDVYFAQGSSLLIHRDVFQEIGYFDDLYFIFFDEVDFARRNLRVGNRIALVPSSRIQHYESGDNDSNTKRKHKKQFYFLRSKYFFHLSDYQMTAATRYEVLKKWVKRDIKDAIKFKDKVGGFWRLMLVYLHVLFYLPTLILKRRNEAIMEKEIIMSKLTECINKVVGDFQMSDFSKNLKDDFGLDSVGIMELLIILEEEFNLQFEMDVDMGDLYSPEFLLQYISKYQR